MATKRRNNGHPAGSARRPHLSLAPDPREHVQTVLARCYVAVAEMDYDLLMWRAELDYPWRVIDLRVPSDRTTRI